MIKKNRKYIDLDRINLIEIGTRNLFAKKRIFNFYHNNVSCYLKFDGLSCDTSILDRCRLYGFILNSNFRGHFALALWSELSFWDSRLAPFDGIDSENNDLGMDFEFWKGLLNHFQKTKSSKYSLEISVSSSSIKELKSNSMIVGVSVGYSKAKLIRGYLVISKDETDKWTKIVSEASSKTIVEVDVVELPVPLSILVGEQRLKKSEFLKLEKGDIILSRCERNIESGIPLLMSLGGKRVRGIYAKNGFKINDIMLEEAKEKLSDRAESKSFENEIKADQGGGNAKVRPKTKPPISTLSIDKVNVELKFEVGRKQMSFAELDCLVPGYIFALENPLSEPVRIVANGVVVGSGRLVDVDNRIGVEVTSIE